MILNLAYPSYFDHIEAYFTVQSLDVFRHPVHTGLSDANRTSMLYGPLPYVIQKWMVGFFDNPILGSKIYGTGLCLCSLILLWTRIFDQFPKLVKIGTMFFCVLLFLQHGHYSFWNRADSLIIFGIVISLLALRSKNRFGIIVFAAVGMAIAILSKIHAVLYCLPILYLLYQKHGTKPVIQISFWLTGLCLLPFFIISTLDLSFYITWVLLSVKHLFLIRTLMINACTAAAYLIPLSIIVWYLRKNIPKFELSAAYVLGGCVIIMTVIASKNGAGNWHLMPFIPVIGWMQGNYLTQYPALFTSIKKTSVIATVLMVFFGLISGALCIKTQGILWRTYFKNHHQVTMATHELNSIQKQFPHESIVMGVGGSNSYELTYLYPLLYKTVGENFLIPSAMMDMQLSGLEIPSATIHKIRSKQIDIFLLPKGSQMFSLPGYFPNRSIFSTEFIDSFVDSYEKIGETQFYEIWHSK